MLTLPKPAAFAGQAYADELAAAGLPVTGSDVYLSADGEVVVSSLNESHQSDAQAVLDSHAPPPPSEPLPTYEELVREVRGIKERAAAATVTDPDAKAVADAVAGAR